MSVYNKPRSMTYTAMAIFIDEHAYDEDMTSETEELIFQYLYHLIKMLARKANYFKAAHYYEDFAIYMATTIFMRYKNPKQFIIKENGEPELSKIKSCLNYIKNTIYPRKVEFEQEYYCQIMSPTEEEELVEYTNYTFANKLIDSIEELSMVEFDMCLKDLAKTARAYIGQIPYKSDKKEWENIYISCLLTFLNRITLSSRNLKRIASMKNDITNRPYALELIYRTEKENSTVLFHLKPSMKGYITILTNGLQHALAKDLSLTMHEYIPSDIGFNAAVFADINGNSIADFEEEW